MKRILSYLISGICVLLLNACDFKEDRAFKEAPDVRMKKTLTEYSEALASAPNGWMFTINTGISGGFQLYMSFNNHDRVVMLCDMDATESVDIATSTQPNESSYQLIALQMPSLIFDTYNYLHLMADPQNSVNGGTNGIGLKSDFEFDILNFDSGVFILRGTYNKCIAFMRQATPEEAQAAIGGELKGAFDRLKAYNTSATAPSVEIDGTKVALAMTGRTATLSWTDAEGVAATATAGTQMDITGDTAPASIAPIIPIEVLGKKVVRFVWNGTCYDAVDDAGAHYPGTDDAGPIIP